MDLRSSQVVKVAFDMQIDFVVLAFHVSPRRILFEKNERFLEQKFVWHTGLRYWVRVSFVPMLINRLLDWLRSWIDVVNKDSQRAT